MWHPFLPLLLLLHGAAAANSPPPKWLTLRGNAPAIVARGGYSGLFPESSEFAYQFALSTSLKDVILLCDLQLTKDGAGICKTDLRLDNSTNIATIFPKRRKTYSVNGESIRGWFSVDFTLDEIYNNITMVQSIYSRPSIFDDSLPLLTVEEVTGLRPSQFWLNVQYYMFFKEHKLDIITYIRGASKMNRIDYISSPEIAFLKGLNGKLPKGKTKLIFRFRDVNAVEPSTNKTYSSLLEDLQEIKSFASGILVPKNYIWPVNKDQYLEPHTTLVTDAHSLGLEIYADIFANDLPASYNYSFDPTAEYLHYIDNSNFSVDGLLTDFPSTASESVACLAYNNNDTARKKGRPLVITHNGASGVFAGSTDLAYQQAVEDGADVIDCSVQMSKDGVAFCLDTADLMSGTNAIDFFMSQSSTVPDIQTDSGIFSFDLTWSDIQTLKPEILSPFAQAGAIRNPAAKNKGKLMTLAEFLEFAKNSTVPGILINIENAPYLASEKGLDIVDAVSGALTNASYDKQTTQQVLIQSDDTAILSIFKKYNSYKRVLEIPETISNTPKPIVDEIKQFAHVVKLPRASLVSTAGPFLSGFTDVMKAMRDANLPVYVSVLRNELDSLPFDFFSDPMVEIATYVDGLGVAGLITEFPATATAYLRSPCSYEKSQLPYTILPTEPGSLLSLAPPEALPPAQAPAPALDAADIVDPPLPPVLHIADEPAPAAAPTTTTTTTTTTDPKSSQPAIAANGGIRCLLTVVLVIISLSYH
ncbi:glycerophosphodiester phosphodiesterase GDPDL7-like [Typha latifolia]|uniref:glycerophosphodiester phosphodiesterase GDPDL7-like n=1 Tax=Typha latifolia TaxID=4733 RepID=UPI003C2DBC79